MLPLGHVLPVGPPFQPRPPRRGGGPGPQPPVEAVLDGVVRPAGQRARDRAPGVAEARVLLEDGFFFGGREGLSVERRVERVVPPAVLFVIILE